ncbi:MAG: cation diffusion facilitator family transporter [Deltaproteobacteria bacterium]|nr:cation diffusion facilitator family transporter [Deltaproteobacteria bacterium]
MASGDGLGDGGGADLVRWGWGSVAVTGVLVLLNGLVAVASGSLAVSAEVVHDVADLLAAASVVAGLVIATRSTPSFPYGLYKAENVVALVIAALVFITAYEIVRDAVLAPASPPRASAWMVALVLLGGAIPLVFGHFEMRAGRAAGSPALIADAREYRLHAFTAMLALAALVSGWIDVRLDRPAALAIVVVVVKTGWDRLRDALRVLLDASVDARCLIEIRDIVRGDPAVREVRWVTGRNAGRYRFIEAGIALRPTDVTAAQAAVARVEGTVRRTVPRSSGCSCTWRRRPRRRSGTRFRSRKMAP